MKLSLLLVATLALSSAAVAAEDGAALYKGKCAGCHGAEGQGKIGPALKGTKLSDADIVDVLTKGAEGKKAPHGKPVAGLSKEQATAVAAYVKSMQ
jgi:mono/diheme cytochrome c family protein